MMAITAIKTDLRNELLRILKEDIPYQVQDGDDGSNLDPDAIVFNFTRTQVNRPFESSNQLLDLPGLVISNPLRTPIRAAAAPMASDEWHYFFLMQLVDNDLWEKPGRIATWDKWIEQIMSAVMFSQMNGVIMPPKGQVKYVAANEVQDIDEKTWVKDGQFISGLEIEIQVYQPRGIII